MIAIYYNKPESRCGYLRKNWPCSGHGGEESLHRFALDTLHNTKNFPRDKHELRRHLNDLQVCSVSVSSAPCTVLHWLLMYSLPCWSSLDCGLGKQVKAAESQGGVRNVVKQSGGRLVRDIVRAEEWAGARMPWKSEEHEKNMFCDVFQFQPVATTTGQQERRTFSARNQQETTRHPQDHARTSQGLATAGPRAKRHPSRPCTRACPTRVWQTPRPRTLSSC